jgi:hypothetical protein
MPSLDELESGIARLTVPYKTISITIDYYPDRVGMNLQRAIAAVTRPPFDVGPVADGLAHVLAGWDLTRNGEPIPLTSDGIGSVGMSISTAIGGAIMEDFHDPKSPRSTATPSASSIVSLPGSKPDGSATAPTGPTSSSVPNGAASIPQTWPDSQVPVGA